MSLCTIVAPQGHLVHARVVNAAGAWVTVTATSVRFADGGALLVGDAAYGPGFWSTAVVKEVIAPAPARDPHDEVLVP